MTRKERFTHVLSWFRENMPVAETELSYKDPFGLLVAVILSLTLLHEPVTPLQLVGGAMILAFTLANELGGASEQ